MKITHLKISSALRFRLSSSDFRSLPKILQEQCSKMLISSVAMALEDNKLWVVHCKRFSIFELSELEQFELTYFTPAKGAGHISINAGYTSEKQGCAYLAGFDFYSDGYLSSAKTFIQDLEPVLGYLPKTVNYGADC